MPKKKAHVLIAGVLFVAALAFVGVGVYGTSQRLGLRGEEMLHTMRAHALLTASTAIEPFIEAARQETVAQAKAEGSSMSAIREATKKAEERIRTDAALGALVQTDVSAVDATVLTPAVEALELALRAYGAEEEAAKAAYIEAKTAQEPSARLPDVDGAADIESPGAEGMAADIGEPAGGGEMLDVAAEPAVDMSGFVATAEMRRLAEIADARAAELAEAMRLVFPMLDDWAVAALKPLYPALVYQSGDGYTESFDRYVAVGGMADLGDDQLFAQIVRYGDDLVTLGAGLAILGLVLLFYRPLLKKLGAPCLIISLFFLLLCGLALVFDLSIARLLSNVIVRVGMNLVLVLAIVPGIQCGISLNLGLPIGAVGGLLGGLLCIEYGMGGWWGLLFALAIGLVISGLLGCSYAQLLNRLKGSEMSVTTYVGFSFIALMCIAWQLLPFNSAQLRWPMGPGLRSQVSVANSYRHLLNNFLSFEIGGVTVPTGLLLFVGLCCLLVWLFLRSKTGVAMQAVGNNPRFAEAAGINVHKMRTVGTALSMMLGAVGIILYAQSYGFMQLYNAPRMLGFVAASAVLLGGASTTRARISHVLIGTFLFHGVMTLSPPVANVLMPQSPIAESMRILLSNGIILYALAQSGGGSRG